MPIEKKILEHDADTASSARTLDESLGLSSLNIDLNTFVNNLPGGVMCCDFNEDLTLRYYSKGFLDLFGCTEEELSDLYGDSFRKLIYEGDRRACDESVALQMSKGTSKVLEYRCYHKDGNLIWVHDRGQLITAEGGGRFFFCILLDVTESHETREQLRMSLERYRIIFDQTTEIIFEWDVGRDTIVFSSNWRKKFGYDPVSDHARDCLSEVPYVHPESIDGFRELIRRFIGGLDYGEIECRIATQANEYIWCRIRATAQKDDEGNLFRVIGIIIDIDEEKKKNDMLLEKSRRDSLTDIYNKATIAELISQRLASISEDAAYALILFDIDNFKVLNDTYGHLCGDQYLVTMSSILQELSPSETILGRVGGDEFMAFCEYSGNFSSVEEYVDRILLAFQGFALNLPDGHIGISGVSCSMGIVRIPEDGHEFQTLYYKADQALYEAKRSGKARYVVYQEH